MKFQFQLSNQSYKLSQGSYNILLFFIVLASSFYSCTSVDSLIEDKNIDKAINFCEKEKENKNICFEKIADEFFKNGDFKNAEKYYDIDFADNIVKRKKSSFQIAEEFLSKKKFNKALKYYEKTSRMKEGFLKVADSYLLLNKLSKALVLYKSLDHQKGVKKIADKYYKNGEYLRALALFDYLKLKNKYSFKIANELIKVRDFISSAKLYEFLGNLNKSRESYKTFAYSLLERNEFKKLLSTKSPIVAIVSSDDYLFAINQKGEIYQSYLYSENLKKVFSISSKKEKVITAKYLKKSNKIILLTNAGLVFYDLVNKKIIRRLNKKITAFAVTEDENFLITANENIISVRDYSSFEELLFFKNHSSRVNEILISKNMVFSAGKDKLIRAWDIETGKELFILRGHFLEITSLDLSNNGKLLASGSKDKTIKLWDLEKRKFKTEFKFKSKVNSLMFSSDSSHLVAALEQRVIKIIDLIEDKTVNSSLFHNSNLSSVLIDRNNNFIYSGSKGGELFSFILEKDLLVEKLLNKSRVSQLEYLKVAELYFKNKKYGLSAKYYQLSNKKEEGISKIGDAYFKLEDYDEALKYYSLLNDEKHLKKVAETYFKLGDYNKSSEYYFRIEDKIGVLKSAKMFLYEENYYDSIKLYISLVKSYDSENEKEKINAIFLKIADIFINMKDSEYKGSNDEKLIVKVNKILKNWYETRYEMAQEYFEKADNKELGYLKIANLLMNDNKFDESISFYEKMEKKAQSRKLIKNCLNKAADYSYQKLGEHYKNFIQLVKDEGDWDLITQNFKSSTIFLKNSNKYYKKLKNYKMLKKLKKVSRKLKNYKKTLGIQ